MRMFPRVFVGCSLLFTLILFGCGSSGGSSEMGGGTGGRGPVGGTGGSGGDGGEAGMGGLGGSAGGGGAGGLGGSGGGGDTPPEGYNKAWRGSVSGLWEDSLNWEPEGVPGLSDNVYISPNAMPQPNKADVAINVNDLLVPQGASITFDGFGGRLNVFGDLDATGGIDGNAGPVILRGGGTLEGTVHQLEVWEPVSLSGDTTITDRIQIYENAVEDDDDASLTLSGHTLTTQRFECCNNGAVGLVMTDPADRLVVDGDARFRFSTGSTLTAGAIELGGDVQFCAGGLETPFRSTGTNVVVSGQEPQMFFSESGCATGAVVLSELELVAPADLTLNLPVQQTGNLVVPEGASIAYLNVPSIFSTIGGDIDLSGSMVVDFPSTAKLQVFGTLKLNATGVLDDAGDIINLTACDPKDGTIVDVDPCP